MTEDEAKQKWCPFMRVDSGEASNYNAFYAQGDLVTEKCIASACMMWEPERRGIEQTPEGHNINVSSGGYCKMATRPEQINE